MNEAKLLAKLRLQREAIEQKYENPSLRHKRSAVIIQRTVRRAFAVSHLLPRVKYARKLSETWSPAAIFDLLVRRQSDIETKKRTAYLMFQHMPDKEIFGSLVEELACECSRTSVEYVFAYESDALRLGYFLNFCLDVALFSNRITLQTCIEIFEEFASKLTRPSDALAADGDRSESDGPHAQQNSGRQKRSWLPRDGFLAALIRFSTLHGYDDLEDFLDAKVRPAVEDVLATRASCVATRRGQSLLFPQIVQTLQRHEEAFKPLYVYYSTSQKVRLSHQVQSWDAVSSGSAKTKGLTYAGAVELLKDFGLAPGLMSYLDYSDAYYNSRQGCWGEQVCSKGCTFFVSGRSLNGNRCRACGRRQVQRSWEESVRLRSAFIRVATMDMGAASENNAEETAEAGQGRNSSGEALMHSFGSRDKQTRAPTFAQLDAIREEEGGEIAMVNPAESMGHIERVLRLFYHNDPKETRRIQHTTIRIRQALGKSDNMRFSTFDDVLRVVESKNRVLDEASLSLPEFMILMVDFARVMLSPHARASLTSLYEAEDADELATAVGKFHSLLQLLNHKYEAIFRQQLIQPDTAAPEQSDEQLPTVQATLDRQLRRVFAGYAARDDPLEFQFISWDSFHLFVRESACFKALTWQEVQTVATEAAATTPSDVDGLAAPGAEVAARGRHSSLKIFVNPRFAHDPHRNSLLHRSAASPAPFKLQDRGRMSSEDFAHAVEKLLFAQSVADHGGESHLDERWYRDGSRSSRGISPEGKIKRSVSSRLHLLYEVYQPASREVSPSARIFHVKTRSVAPQAGPKTLALLHKIQRPPKNAAESFPRTGSACTGVPLAGSGKREGAALTPQQLLHNHKLRLATQQVTEENVSKTVWGALLGLTQNERSQEAANAASSARKSSQRIRGPHQTSSSSGRRRSSIARQDNIRALREEVEQDFAELIDDLGAPSPTNTDRARAPAKPTGSPRAAGRFRSPMQSPRARSRHLREEGSRVADGGSASSPQGKTNQDEKSASGKSVFHLTMQEDFAEFTSPKSPDDAARSPSQASARSDGSGSDASSCALWTAAADSAEDEAAPDGTAIVAPRWPLSRFPQSEGGKLQIDANFDSLQMITRMARALEASEGAQRHAERFGAASRPRVTFRTAPQHNLSLQVGEAAPKKKMPTFVSTFMTSLETSETGEANAEAVAASVQEKEQQDYFAQKKLFSIGEDSGIRTLENIAEGRGFQLSPRHARRAHEVVLSQRPSSAAVRAKRAVVQTAVARKQFQVKLDALTRQIEKENTKAEQTYDGPLLALLDGHVESEAEEGKGEQKVRHEARDAANKAPTAEACSKPDPKAPQQGRPKVVVSAPPSTEAPEAAFVACFKRGKRERSLHLLDQAYNIASEHLCGNPRLAMAVLREMVALKRIKGDLQGALATAETLLGLCAPVGYEVSRCHVLAAKAQIQLQCGDGAGAELTERDRLALATSYALGETASSVENTSGRETSNPNNSSGLDNVEDDAPILPARTLPLSQRAAQAGVGPSLASIGAALRAQGKLHEALEMHEHHEKYAAAAQRWEDQRRARMDKAAVLHALGDGAEACKILRDLLAAQRAQRFPQGGAAPGRMSSRERIEMLVALVKIAMTSPIMFEESGRSAAKELCELAASIEDRASLAIGLEASFKADMLDLEHKDLRPIMEVARKLVLPDSSPHQRLLQLRSAVKRAQASLPAELVTLVRAEESLSRALKLRNDGTTRFEDAASSTRERLDSVRAMLLGTLC